MNQSKLKKVVALYNLVLGGLIALEFEKQKKITLNETIILGKWLKRAKKQKIYPKSLTEEIDYFIDLYYLKGRNANLSYAFNKIYRELKLVQDIPVTDKQPDKVRFDAAMEALSVNDWSITLPIAHDPSTGSPYRPENKKEIFTTKWYWDNAFDKQNNLAKELSIFVISTPQKVINCFYQFGFILIKGVVSSDKEGNDYSQFILFPANEYNGDIAFPTEV